MNNNTIWHRAIIANSQLLLDNAAVVSGDFKSIKPKRFLFF
ncbi:protein of unknown function [Brochothrix thermosphacta]|nr:hypothetical protein FM106_11880 [Brachybacterium faecium]SOC29511.1 hypothetical protein BTH160X_50306 [Brochothrix thermosphacta]SPN72056.1 protein of unknown function [Brochothrix thermosphacta]